MMSSVFVPTLCKPQPPSMKMVFGAGCNNVGQPELSFLPALGLVVSQRTAGRKTPLLSKRHASVKQDSSDCDITILLII